MFSSGSKTNLVKETAHDFFGKNNLLGFDDAYDDIVKRSFELDP